MTLFKQFLIVLTCCAHNIGYASQAPQAKTTQPQKQVTALEMHMLIQAKSGTLTAKRLQRYLSQGVNINAQDNDGLTALMKAASHPYIGSAQLLIQHGADIEIKDDDGETALTHAVVANRPKLAQLLIDKGAHIDTQDKYGNTPLMAAASVASAMNNGLWLGKTNVITLLNAGANPYIQSYDEKAISEYAHTKLPDWSEAKIQVLVANTANKTFFTLMNPQLLNDPEVQKALANNKHVIAYEKYKAAHKQAITQDVSTHILPELANIVNDYVGIPVQAEMPALITQENEKSPKQ